MILETLRRSIRREQIQIDSSAIWNHLVSYEIIILINSGYLLIIISIHKNLFIFFLCVINFKKFINPETAQF